MICCASSAIITASRTRAHIPSSSRAGRAARSMPARWSLPSRSRAMAKTKPPLAPDKEASPERVAAFRTGLSAESRAAALLMAKRRNLTAFVEVKARASLDEAAYAVTPRQQGRIINAAQAWLAAHPDHAEFELRFDAILIAPRRLPRHVLAAFDASP